MLRKERGGWLGRRRRGGGWKLKPAQYLAKSSATSTTHICFACFALHLQSRKSKEKEKGFGAQVFYNKACQQGVSKRQLVPPSARDVNGCACVWNVPQYGCPLPSTFCLSSGHFKERWLSQNSLENNAHSLVVW